MKGFDNHVFGQLLEIEREEALAEARDKALRAYAEENAESNIGDAISELPEDAWLAMLRGLFDGDAEAWASVREPILRSLLESSELGFERKCERDRLDNDDSDRQAMHEFYNSNGG